MFPKLPISTNSTSEPDDSIVGPGAAIHGGCIVCGLSVLGTGCVVEEGNVLDQGARVNPGVRLPKGVISF